jgi:hypothetical protein
MEVAKTILEQLGGREFIAMTGTKNFGSYSDGINMTIQTNKSKAKYLKIILTPMDTYTMEFYSMNKNFEKKVKVLYEDIYCDQLQNLFTEATGLYTSL